MKRKKFGPPITALVQAIERERFGKGAGRIRNVLIAQFGSDYPDFEISEAEIKSYLLGFPLVHLDKDGGRLEPKEPGIQGSQIDR